MPAPALANASPSDCLKRSPPQSLRAFELTSGKGTGFATNYGEFLACRALFGAAMGGLYGNAAATALEDLPEDARGMMSGILQQGVRHRGRRSRALALSNG